MATLAVTNSFAAGTTIVASEMNTNFDDVEAFVNTTPGVVQNDIVDAKGDIISASAADTIVRTAVGSDGQVLTALASGSGGVAWADSGRIVTTTTEDNTHTFAVANGGKTFYMSGASGATTLTVPQDSGWDATPPVGTHIIFARAHGSNAVTFAAGTGATLNSKDDNLSIDGQFATAAIIKTAANTWLLFGALA